MLLHIESNNENFLVNTDKILYFSGDENHVNIYFLNNIKKINLSLSFFEFKRSLDQKLLEQKKYMGNIYLLTKNQKDNIIFCIKKDEITFVDKLGEDEIMIKINDDYIVYSSENINDFYWKMF